MVVVTLAIAFVGVAPPGSIEITSSGSTTRTPPVSRGPRLMYRPELRKMSRRPRVLDKEDDWGGHSESRVVGAFRN